MQASGRKKAISLIPAMPSKKPSRSSTRMHAAGATLSRNKLLKLVSRKGTDGESIQFDHDYCSNDSLSHLEFVVSILHLTLYLLNCQMTYMLLLCDMFFSLIMW